MSKRVGIVALCFFIFLMLLIVFANLTGIVTFGHGLGDLYYLFFAIIILFIIAISGAYFLIKKNKFPTFILICLISTLFWFTLKLTILRGPEYKWNDKILKDELVN